MNKLFLSRTIECLSSVMAKIPTTEAFIASLVAISLALAMWLYILLDHQSTNTIALIGYLRSKT